MRQAYPFFTDQDKRAWRAMNRPPVSEWPVDSPLSELVKAQDALAMMFEGLQLHYGQSIAQGRTQEWAEAGHAIINLMATTPVATNTHH